MRDLHPRAASSSCNLTPQQVAEVVAQSCPTNDYRGKRVLLIVPDGTRTAPRLQGDADDEPLSVDD